MRLQAGDTFRADVRVMHGAGRQLKAIAIGKVDGHGTAQTEPDRSALDDDDLVVAVVMSAVAVARTVRPSAWVETLGAEQGIEVGAYLVLPQAAATPMIEPMA